MRKNSQKYLYESIMQIVDRNIRKVLNEVSTQLLNNAEKKAQENINDLMVKFKDSNFTDEEILKLLQKRARQSNAFKQAIIDNNNALFNETTGKFNRLINKWKNGVIINDDDESIEVIPTFVISEESEYSYWSSDRTYRNNHHPEESVLSLDVYLININKYKKLLNAGKTLSDNDSIQKYQEIVDKINSIYDEILSDFTSLGMELYDRIVSDKYNERKNDYTVRYLNAKRIINDKMCFHFKITNKDLQKYFNDDFFDTYYTSSRTSTFDGWSRSEKTTYKSKHVDI